MTNSEQKIAELYKSHFGAAPDSIVRMPGAGSDRAYYRVTSPEESGAPATVIATVGDDLMENRAFLALARHFRSAGLSVPQVYAASYDDGCYLQEDLGGCSLFDAIASGRVSGRFNAEEIALLEESLRMLAAVQIRGAQGLDFSVCYPEKAMDGRLIDWDLNYFKYCFLKSSGILFPESALHADFSKLKAVIEKSACEARTFMVRDFQSRNVMIGPAGKPVLIDFQGGRRGPAEYDVASFLWQAKAGIPDDLKRHLTDVYVEAAKELDCDFDSQLFRERLHFFALFRLLQVLGAYGFRGWHEGKGHFLQSIPSALRSALSLIDSQGYGDLFPELRRVLESVLSSAKVRQMEAELLLPPFDGLTVKVFSFSYKKGVPADLTGNGGGFLFDCRAVHNPGRYEQYKRLTGRDEAVRRFLEDNGEIFTFLDHCRALVFASVERYLSRGFNALSVGFGCTGGQHRSVYSAEAMARAIKENFPNVRVILIHAVQDIVEVL